MRKGEKEEEGRREGRDEKVVLKFFNCLGLGVSNSLRGDVR